MLPYEPPPMPKGDRPDRYNNLVVWLMLGGPILLAVIVLIVFLVIR